MRIKLHTTEKKSVSTHCDIQFQIRYDDAIHNECNGELVSCSLTRKYFFNLLLVQFCQLR